MGLLNAYSNEDRGRIQEMKFTEEMKIREIERRVNWQTAVTSATAVSLYFKRSQPNGSEFQCHFVTFCGWDIDARF
jgi:hypothetical protein